MKKKKKSSISIHKSSMTSHRRHNSAIDPSEILLMPPIVKEEIIVAPEEIMHPPATIKKDQIHLPKIHKSLTSDCPICFNLMIEPTKLSCKHHFCMQCMERVIKSTKCVCPLCRHPITRLDLKIDREMQKMIKMEDKGTYK